MDGHSLMTDTMFAAARNDLSPANDLRLAKTGSPSACPPVGLNDKARDSKPDVGTFER